METIIGGSASGCDSVITVNLTFVDIANIGFADAGMDIQICDGLSSTLLIGNLPNNTTGEWTSLNSATVINPNNNNTNVIDFQFGPNEFVWSLSTTQCNDYDSDTVIVFYDVVEPDAIEDNFTSFIETLYEDNVTQNDILTDISNWETNLITTPDDGTLTLNLDGTFSYLPPDEYCGQVTFEYELCNINCPDLCDIGMVTINVIPETDNDLDAPNVITPNGDKYNESLIIPRLYNNR